MKLLKNNNLKKSLKKYKLIIIVTIVILLAISMYFLKEGFEEEKKGLDMFDAIVYINLENRNDRKKLILEELKKMNAPEHKIHKVSGVYIPKNGHKGCIQSHILALQMALMNKWDTTVIIEDDAELIISIDEFNKKLSDALSELNNKEWDVLMLCTSNKKVDEKLENEFKHIDKLQHATSGICYIIKKHYIPKLLKLFEHCNTMMTPDKWGDNNDFEPYALDQKWNELIKKDNWYSLKGDNVIYQKSIKSSINSRE